MSLSIVAARDRSRRRGRIDFDSGAKLAADREQACSAGDAGPLPQPAELDAMLNSGQPGEGGGGGTGTIGTGKYGTLGHGSGAGYGPTANGTLSSGALQVTGNLDQAVVGRYIKRHAEKVQYCYEKQQQTTPSLAGSMVVEPTIGSDGKVTATTAKGVDKTLETCVAGVVTAIEFKAPASGTVKVKQTFSFKPPSH